METSIKDEIALWLKSDMGYTQEEKEIVAVLIDIIFLSNVGITLAKTEDGPITIAKAIDSMAKLRKVNIGVHEFKIHDDIIFKFFKNNNLEKATKEKLLVAWGNWMNLVNGNAVTVASIISSLGITLKHTYFLPEEDTANSTQPQ